MRLSNEEAAEKITDLFIKLIASESFIVNANKWAQAVSTVLFQLDASPEELIPEDLLATLPEGLAQYTAVRYDDESRLAALAISAAGILVCDPGTTDKLEADELKERFANFCQSLWRICCLAKERGQAVEMNPNGVN